MQMSQTKSNKTWIALKGSVIQALAHLAFWFFFVGGTIFFTASIIPSEVVFLFQYTHTSPFWGTRFLFFLIGIGGFYLAIKSRVVIRFGRKIIALKDAIDLSISEFSFENKGEGISLITPHKSFSLGKTVLYLRSFGIDQQKEVEEGTEDLTYEEQIAAILNDIGQLVCIGHPGEPLPEPGALRLYYKNHDEGWKRIISGLLPTSELIVLRAGTSAGLSWEMEQVKSFVNPERFVVLILGAIDDRLKALKIIEQVFEMDIDLPDEDFLPENKDKKSVKRHEAAYCLGYVVHFDQYWQPQVESIPIHLGCIHGLFYDDSRTAKTRLKLAFQPVFKRLGFRWRLKLSWLSVISLGFVMLLILFLAFAFLYKKITGQGLLSE
jgi:hypothetical protein